MFAKEKLPDHFVPEMIRIQINLVVKLLVGHELTEYLEIAGVGICLDRKLMIPTGDVPVQFKMDQ